MKQIVLQLGKGSLPAGFPSVNVELTGDGCDGWGDTASLLPDLELERKYQQWQRLYRASVRLGGRGVTFAKNNAANASIAEIYQTTQDLTTALNNWLNQGDFYTKIQARLRRDLNADDRILLSIITDDDFLWKLPWHRWDFCTAYEHCVESFSRSYVRNNRQQRLRANGKVDILAIWGNAPELGLDRDLAALQQPHARVTACQPKSALAISDALAQQQQIRMLFFGGHGETIELELEAKIQTVGKIYLDKDTPISIAKIKTDLKQAIDRGLQIAIFNCCSGLGLAQELADLNIPYLVVMRSQIPDKLAQQFCRDLLGRYSQGGDFTTAFGYARGRSISATDRDDEFESWLPMLVHNPHQQVTWADLSRSWWQLPAPQPVIAVRRWLTKSDRLPLTWIGISLLSTGITVGLQTLSPIQKLESLAIDRLQLAQVAIMPMPSQTIVVDTNDDDEERVNVSGESISSGAQLQQLANLPFLALGSDLKIESEHNDNWLKQSNISINCEARFPQINYAPISRTNDCQPLAWAVTKNYPAVHSRSIDRDLILNPYLASTIERIKLSDISKQNSDRFKGKILLVGVVKDLSSPVMIHAIATEQIVRSIDPHRPLLTGSRRSIEIVYILIWSGIGGAAIFYTRRLYLPLVAIACLCSGGILFMCGYLLPLIPAAIGVGISSYLVCLIKLPNESSQV
ncbi:hypothetical protein [Chamaesiphon sp. GL140_3_metabinner_50]|uniref:hypothetical protein n=1 Tax=Chamaesiphon sp. GL140_3_metabinner_50 TaxID=2970812 RepID=UPI0025F7C869|nr:hypothetical protein [Chamaesiphon sp. GL140_3_metabinner_50]